MRSDQSGFRLDPRFDFSLPVVPAFAVGRTDDKDGSSRSAHERNRLFLSLYPDEPQFADVSGISGLDSVADGRAFAHADFDHDGWIDVAVVNSSAPLLELFRNAIGTRPGLAARGSIAIRLVGGHRGDAPSGDWSNRDGYGARIRVAVGGETLLRELRCGEGLSTQNSKTLLIGIGDAASASSVRVDWPSGRRQELGEVEAGTLLTIFENPEEAPGDEPATRTAYGTRPARVNRALPIAGRARTSPWRVPEALAASSASRLVLYTAMTTTCASCIGELDELAGLRERFGPSELAMVALPVDPSDTQPDLEHWDATHAPAFDWLRDYAPSDIEHVRARITAELGSEGTPASVVADAGGRVVLVRWGAPSVSEIRRLLSRAE